MTAERLQEAAKVLRERAEVATPGPWKRSNVYGYKIVGPNLTPTVGHVDPAQGASRPHTIRHAVIESTNGSNGDYIATMHPGVGLAVAELLDEAAEDWRLGVRYSDPALVMADAILGGQS